MSYYYYCYYIFYTISRFISVKDDPDIKAWAVMTLFMLLNLITIVLIPLDMIIGHAIYRSYNNIINYGIVIITIIISIINWKLLVADKLYEFYAEYFSNKRLQKSNYLLEKCVFIFFSIFWIFGIIIFIKYL